MRLIYVIQSVNDQEPTSIVRQFEKFELDPQAAWETTLELLRKGHWATSIVLSEYPIGESFEQPNWKINLDSSLILPTKEWNYRNQLMKTSYGEDHPETSLFSVIKEEIDHHYPSPIKEGYYNLLKEYWQSQESQYQDVISEFDQKFGSLTEWERMKGHCSPSEWQEILAILM